MTDDVGVEWLDLPGEWSARPLLPEDAEGVLGLARAIGEAAGIEPMMSAADVAADLTSPIVVLDRDTRLVLDAEGQIAAYVIVYDEAPGRTDAEVLIDPRLDAGLQDRLLDALIEWYVEAAFAIAERRGVDRTVAVLAAARVEDRMFAAYARHGFSYARTFWRMELSLSDPHPAPFVPNGMTLRAVDPDRDDVLRRLHRLDTLSFAEHYGYVPVDEVTFMALIRGLGGFERQGTWIAVDDATGDDAGFLIGTDRRADEGQGYVAILGVLPQFRGRGVAKALLATAFDYYRLRGMTGVQLGVDAENSTGATDLYRAVGMHEAESFDVWELPLTLSTDEGVDEGVG